MIKTIPYSIVLFLLIISINLQAQTEGEKLQKQFTQIYKEVDSLYPPPLRKYFKYKPNQTLLIGVNKSLLKNNFQTEYGISIYYLLGLFVSNYCNETHPIPGNYYSKEYISNYSNELTVQGIPFTPARFSGTKSSFVSYNYGVYLSPVRYVYVMAGISRLKGSVWDLYDGNLNDPIRKSEIYNQYVVDYKKINMRDFLFGIAVVFPLVQVETGYNRLYRSFFVNVGANIPVYDFWFKK
jgi:hypothetical protein